MTKREEELFDLITHHNELYYDKDQPEISDFEYDKLVKELKKLDPDNPLFINEIGHPTYGQKFKHQTVMGSLSKCHTVEEIIKKFDNQEVILMPKVDGCSLALHYKDGALIRAVTRGDGYEGEIVTENARMISDIPSKVNLAGTFEARGEAYISKSDFYGTMDQPGYADMEHGMANPRNCAAGALRQKDAKLTAERKVRFVAYKLLGEGFAPSQNECLGGLRMLGFETVPYVLCRGSDAKAIQVEITAFQGNKLPYETDGVVIMLNDLNKFEEEGYSGKCPKGALAFKFETEKRISKVRGITWQVGRTGKITPVAEIEAVHISGSTVRRISLHNLDWLNKMDVAIGDMIQFEKANEIIPEIVQVMSRVGVRHTNQPHTCPVCGENLIINGAYLQCPNSKCSAQVVSHMRFVLETFGVKGLDETTIEKLLDAGIVKVDNVASILRIEKAKLIDNGFGKTESENWIKALSNIKTTPAKLLACLGIEGWGETMFEKLFSQSRISGNVWLSSILMTNTRLGMETPDIYAHISDMGPVRKTTLLKGLEEKHELLGQLVLKVKIEEEVQNMNGTLSGKSFCITGTLSKGRKEIQEDIKKAGGIVKDSVSKGLDYLVTGEDCGSKYAQAVKFNIKTILESDLYSMIGG